MHGVYLHLSMPSRREQGQEKFTLPEPGILVLCGVSLYAVLCPSLRNRRPMTKADSTY